ncbi:beta-N-acetylglucosaminidase domain-containing protein [Margalitia sp. FSL K6-0131]|uniref:beta-N-acetylglucosaminidase domain-containing protein n=1 Tax=Margalitia sp. FSL K6-0131 TaxID=2954604 RepID=UPI0030F8E34E
MKKRFWIHLGIIFTMILSTVITFKTQIVSAKEHSPKEYEIYPVPHQVTYHDGTMKLNKPIQVIYDDTIDSVTKKKVENVLKQNDYQAPRTGTKPAKDKINLLVGTKNSSGPVDTYATNNLSSEGMDFSKIDAYDLDIQNNTITILGKDSDASFYGVVTLNAILSQAKNKEVRNLTIQDYANTKIRGFIEGYYGIPWSNEDRMSLMRFGGNFKMTSYIFAPKDDPYHREKWDELYPAEKLAEIKEMAQVGNENKTRFVWTISPLGEVARIAQSGGDPMLKLKENTDKMLAKFDQLYDVGVRQFGVLGDDVGSLPTDYVVKLMNSVSDWAKEKGDVYDILYCPASYNSSWAWNPAELNAYEKGFPKNIQIFWTGSTTCAPIEQSTIDTFKNRSNGGVVRRDPLFWLNWPVNDVDMSRVFLGKGEMLQPGIKNLAGAVTNPMQEAEASKIALFALADYTWNTETFNADKSWNDSFKYIEPNATEELHTLAKHMSDAYPNGLALSESEDIKGLLDSITSKVNNGESIKDVAPEAKDQLQKIANAANGFLAKTKNKKLKTELTPFVKALRDMVLADIEFIKTDLAIESGNKADTWNHFSKATTLRKQSLNYDRPILNGTMKTKPAKKRLQPFTDNLQNKITPKVTKLLDIKKEETKASIFTNVAAYQNLQLTEEKTVTSINNAAPIKLNKGQYLGLKLNRVKDITNIEAPSAKGLILETSLNGIEWKKAGKKPADARYVRLLNKQAKPVQFTLGTLKVTSYEVEPKSVKETNYTSVENPLALFDGDYSTPAWFKNSQIAGKYITYNLGQEITLHNLKAVITKTEHDYPRHAVLEASLDGNQWTTVMTFGSQSGENVGEVTDDDQIDAIFDKLEDPYRVKEVKNLNQKIKYIRLKVTRTKTGSDKWVRLQELVINDGQYYPELNDPTITTPAVNKAGNTKDNLIDGNLETKFEPIGKNAGQILYHIGEAEKKVTGITILEDPNSLSSGKISVRTTKGWRKLGTISAGYHFFQTNKLPQVLDLKIDWQKGKAPSIYEIKIDKK